VRAQAGRAGAVVCGIVSQVRQPRPNFKPCTIEVDSDQGIIRFRLDDKVRIVGTNVTGVVRGLSAAPSGGTRIQIEIAGGVRQRHVLSVGAALEVIHEGFCFVNLKAFEDAHQRLPWVFYGTAPPMLIGGAPSGQSALAIAAKTRLP
jgi:hypothetical protein